jgi:hypothetical protein
MEARLLKKMRNRSEKEKQNRKARPRKMKE